MFLYKNQFLLIFSSFNPNRVMGINDGYFPAICQVGSQNLTRGESVGKISVLHFLILIRLTELLTQKACEFYILAVQTMRVVFIRLDLIYLRYSLYSQRL